MKKIIILLFILSGIIFADGFIIMPEKPILLPPERHRPEMRTPFPLEVKYHDVDVKIDNIVATTSIDQVFVNPTSRRLEGMYIFPIPKGAVIEKFSMYIDGQEMEAEILDAKKAKKIYEDIVRKQQDPALLEYIGNGMIKLRIFPIEPKSEKRIKIVYNELLTKSDNQVKYTYPLNTEKFSSKELQEVNINIEIISNEKIVNVYSPTHEAIIKRKNEKNFKVKYKDNDVKPDKDFVLYFSNSNKDIGASIITHKEFDENGYFLLNISPPEFKNDDFANKDITFIVDNSGSMAGKKLKQAKNALQYCIENLDRNDRFEIIRFSTEAEAMFEGLKYANGKNIRKATDFIEDLRPYGGTNIMDAISKGLANGDSNRTHIIVFITDGKPTIGETSEKEILKVVSEYENTRIFTFGIGEEINTHLLDKITEKTRAYRNYILPEEDIELAISSFYDKIRYPALTDIKLSTKNIKLKRIQPNVLPDIFKGETLTILGRYKDYAEEGEVIITGKVNGQTKKFRFIFTFPEENEDNEFVPRLWAERRVGYLLDQIRLHGEDEELVNEIIRLSKKYGIITKYTSQIILEDEESTPIVRRRDKKLESFIKNNIANSKQSFSGMQSKSGRSSIESSKEIQEMGRVYNLDQLEKSQERVKIKKQIKNIGGKTFYNLEGKWIDTKERTQEGLIKIKFASQKYFDLIDKYPGIQKFISIGKNISFEYKGNYYEISE